MLDCHQRFKSHQTSCICYVYQPLEDLTFVSFRLMCTEELHPKCSEPSIWPDFAQIGDWLEKPREKQKSTATVDADKVSTQTPSTNNVKALNDFNEHNDRLHRKYLEGIHNGIKTNPSDFWKFVKLSKNKSSIPDEMYLDNQSASSVSEALDLFAAHFESVYDDLVAVSEIVQLRINPVEAEDLKMCSAVQKRRSIGYKELSYHCNALSPPEDFRKSRQAQTLSHH